MMVNIIGSPYQTWSSHSQHQHHNGILLCIIDYILSIFMSVRVSVFIIKYIGLCVYKQDNTSLLVEEYLRSTFKSLIVYRQCALMPQSGECCNANVSAHTGTPGLSWADNNLSGVMLRAEECSVP